jgi:hypothetical protein
MRLFMLYSFITWKSWLKCNLLTNRRIFMALLLLHFNYDIIQEDLMKSIAMGIVVAVLLLAAGQAYAAWGSGSGAWWMDGDEPVTAGTNGTCATCTGGVFQSGTGLGLGLGNGDGTQPQPQDGSGFGSPWM